jgi:predicted dienelactone hydrolase
MIVGHRSGWFEDDSRSAWRSADWPRDLALTCWYPALAGSRGEDLIVGPPDTPAFVLSNIAKDADPAPGRHPVVLLSLGDSGSPYGLHGLAAGLVAEGYIVLGAHHHGTGTMHPLMLEGQLAWWEAARDLSFLLNCVAEEGPLAGHLDLERVSALVAGAGALAVLFLLGGQLDDKAWQAFTKATGGDDGEAQLAQDAVFQESRARGQSDYRDTRIKAACLLCPAPAVEGLPPASLGMIETPVMLLGDEGTLGAADWLKVRLPKAELAEVQGAQGEIAARIAGFLRGVSG